MQLNWHRDFLIVCAVLFTAVAATAANRYVDKNHPSASDGNPGTEDLPWLTLGWAASQAMAGDTVYVKAGTYSEQLAPENSGSDGSPVIFAAYPGDTVTLDGTGVAIDDYSGLVFLDHHDHVTIRGFRVVHSRAHDNTFGISVEGCTEIVISDNFMSDTSSSGIIVWGSDGVLLDGNEVELACNAGADSENECISIGETSNFELVDNYVHDGNSVRGEGIDAKDGSSWGLVHSNHVHNVQSVGIYVDAWDKHTHHIDISDNLVHDIDGNAISIASEQGGLLEHIRVFNNVAYGCRWNGVSVSNCCEDPQPVGTHPIDDLQVVNNTLYGNGWTAAAGGDDWGGGVFSENPEATDMVVRNNVVSDNLSFQIAFENGASATVDHNLIDGFRGYGGETRGTAYQEGDPGFASATTFDFHLEEGSIAIDNGSSALAPDHDHDGTARPQDSGVDIGAFEFDSGLIFRDDFETGDMSAWSQHSTS